MTQSAILFTGLGRYVGGDHANKRTKDNDGRDIPLDKQQFEVGVAFDKTDPDLPRWLNPVFAHAYSEFSRDPQVQAKINEMAQHFCTNSAAWQAHYGKSILDGMSWKIWDGDKPNKEGQVSEHTRGKWVFYFKSAYPIKCSNSQNAEVPTEAIKRGDYVDMAFTVAGNTLAGENAGLYWNPQFLRIVYEGDPISSSGGNPSQVFAAPAQYAMPTGARAPGAHAPAPAMAMPGGAPMPSAAPAFGAPQPGFTGAPSAVNPPTQHGAFPTNPSASAAPPSHFSPNGAPAAPAFGAPAASPAPSGPLPTGFPGSHPTFANGPQQ